MRKLLPRLFAFGLLSAAVALPTGCQPAKLSHQLPGPNGCGKRDPRGTAPGMLSVAQNKVLQNQGEPFDVRPNEKGGLDWMFKRNRGSVFGQTTELLVFQFDTQGLLFNQSVEVIERLGKG